MTKKQLETTMLAAALGLGGPTVAAAQPNYDPSGQLNQYENNRDEAEMDRQRDQAEDAQQQSEDAARAGESEAVDPVEDTTGDAFDCDRTDEAGEAARQQSEDAVDQAERSTDFDTAEEERGAGTDFDMNFDATTL